MLKKVLFIGLVTIVVGMGLVIPALAKTDLPPSATPTLTADAAATSAASLVVTPGILTVDGRSMPTVIMGAGFPEQQDIAILIHAGGVVSDISYLMKPPAKANEFGAFAGDMTLVARMYGRKLLPTGVYTLSAVDMDGNTLATAPLWLIEPPAAE